MTIDPTRKFEGYAADYTAGRPGYAIELIDCFFSNHGLTGDSVIADIGSGTGKFAKFLIERGNYVYCVEPNDDMRSTAEKELSGYTGFHSVNGGAEDTSLPDSSVDFITTAQAFHWFDVEKFRSECSRILKDNGKVALIWNVRNMNDPINQDLHSLFSRYCPDFVGFSGGIVKDDQRIKDFFRDKYEYVAFDNPLYLDKDKFIARCLSGSYSIKEGDNDFDIYMAEIERIFDKYSDNGSVSISNSSVAYIGAIC